MRNIKKATVFNKRNILTFLLVIVLNSIVLLSFYPGIVPYDGNNQWNQVVSGNIQNNHPFFSTFFMWLLSKIWFSPTTLIVYQIILLSFIWTYICQTLNEEGKIIKQLIYTIIICFIPLIFMYTITVWKDIIYTYNLLLLTLMIYLGIKKQFHYNKFEVFIICLTLVLIQLYRFNGIIVDALVILFILVGVIKNRIGIKKIIASLCLFITLFGITRLPQAIMYKPDESLKKDVGPIDGIVMYIITTYAKYDKITDEEDVKLLDEIYPIDAIKKHYNGFLINTMNNSDYNKEACRKNLSKVYKLFFKCILKHPTILLKHYAQVDNLLFGTHIWGENGYVYIYEFDNWYGNNSGDFNKKTNPKLKGGYNFYLSIINKISNSDIGKIAHMPANIMYLSLVLLFIYCKRKNSFKYMYISLPMVGNTISLMFVNLAQDLRYCYINYLFLLLFLIPLIIFDKKTNFNETKKEKKKMKTLVIVPAYNEALNIEKTIKDIKENSKYDYIIINDCSKDNTLEVCKKNNFNYLSLPVNYGLTSGIQLGMKYALENGYDIAIQFDGDGQHQAKYLEPLSKEVESGECDISIGSRFVTEKKPKSMRMLGSNIISACIKITTGKTIKDPTSGMRAYNKEIIERFVKDSSLTPEPDTIAYLIKKGKKIKEVQVEMKEREFGESYLKPLKAAEYMTNMVFSILFFRNFQK